MQFGYRCFIKYFKISIFLLIIFYCMYLIHSLLSNKVPFRKVNLKYVVVHIDLKGAPPTLKFLKKMLQEMKKLEANALLMEYEDVFPYKNKLVNLSRAGHYRENELKDFLIEAAILGLEVIPLVQTFGHMEFVLKHQEFRILSESPHSVGSICPSKPASLELIEEMLRQIIEFHTSITPLKHLHIGCDEVFYMNVCADCRKRNLTEHGIYFQHLEAVTAFVHKLSPKTTVLIWDDMLRSIKPYEWRNFGKIPNIEPVYWQYSSVRNPYLSFYLYHQHFDNLWIAGAFKGADERSAIFPKYEKRKGNILSWMFFIQNLVIAGENGVYNFKGFILTGWSRFSHFEPLCELLPISYKTLVTSLILVDRFQKGIDVDDIHSRNNFNEIFKIDYYERVGCKYVTSSGKEEDKCILSSALSLYSSMKDYYIFFKRINSSMKLNSSIVRDMKKNNEWCLMKIKTLSSIEEKVKTKMRLYYTSKIINEYFDDKSSNIRKRLIDCVENH